MINVYELGQTFVYLFGFLFWLFGFFGGSCGVLVGAFLLLFGVFWFSSLWVVGVLVGWWIFGAFLKGAEDEACELVYSVQMMASCRFAGGLLMCAGGQACFA